jgi:hypothetical protein
MCHDDKETWSHLWQCSQLKPRLQSLLAETKSALEQWIITVSTRSNVAFNNTWHNQSCWQYPREDNTNTLSFDYLVRGFVPKQLTKELSSYLNKKESLKALGDILTATNHLFNEHIWKFRCKEFGRFEETMGITQALKTTFAKPPTRHSSSTRNSAPSHASPSDRWRSWIVQSLLTGSYWMGFRIYINIL